MNYLPTEYISEFQLKIYYYYLFNWSWYVHVYVVCRSVGNTYVGFKSKPEADFAYWADPDHTSSDCDW